MQKLVIVINGVTTGDVLERWVFNVETDRDSVVGGKSFEKSEKSIMEEIQAIIRQITASVTFLPLLNEPCTFDLLVYTDNSAKVPTSWEESDPRYIANSTEVRLRSFTTKVSNRSTKARLIPEFVSSLRSSLFSVGAQGRCIGRIQNRWGR